MSTKLIQPEAGAIQNLELREVESPSLGADEVRVRFTAGGINPLDWKIATGIVPAAAFHKSFPLLVGSDFAGVIEEVGAHVEGFSVGDRVYGSKLNVGFGSEIVGTVKALGLQHTPERVEDEVAGSLVTVANTAVAAIDDLGDINGATILIGGGNGGVGSIAVQYAVSKGARVLATGSERSADKLRSLGAVPVTYGEGLVDRVREAAPEGVSAVADLHGEDAMNAGLELGVPAERITVIAAVNPAPGVKDTGARNARRDALTDVMGRIERGELTVPVSQVFPLTEAVKAYEVSMGGHSGGRIVLTA